MARLFNDSSATLSELIEKDASELASSLTSNSNDQTKTQLRRFYQEYRSLRDRINSNDENYKLHEPSVKMMLAKVRYAQGRQTSIDSQFCQWFEDNIREIKRAKDVEDFGKYFEAFVGYYYGAKRQREVSFDKDKRFNNNWGGKR